MNVAKEAMLYEKLPDGRARCDLCAHHCVIADGKKGICRVRENRGGNWVRTLPGTSAVSSPPTR